MNPSFRDATALLAHAQFLRGLARSLVFDADAAADLEQDTWRTALAHPPRDHASPRGWLATVARNLVRAKARADGRRERRELATARRDAVPSTADIVAREAIRRDVVAAVLALDEPYRDVLLLRFYEDLPPREIARILAIPVETARTREKRGLAKLREALDARYGGDRRSWCVAIAPLTATAKSSVGVAAIVAVATLVLAVPLGWLWWSRPAEPLGRPVVRVDPEPRPTTALVDPAAPTARDAATRTESESGATLRGTVSMPGGEPAIGATVVAVGTRLAIDDLLELRRAGDLVDSLQVVRATTDASGAFALRGLEPGPFLLRAAAADGSACLAYATLFVETSMAAAIDALGGPDALDDVFGPGPRIDVDGDATCALQMIRAGTVLGRVEDTDGRAIAGAEVLALAPDLGTGPQARGWASFDDLLRTAEPLAARAIADTNGTFVVAGVVGSGVVMARAPGFFVDGVRVVVEPDGDTVATPTLRRRLDVDLRGIVHDPSGAPIEGARVDVLSASAPAANFSDLGAPGQVTPNQSRSTTTDREGSFAFGALPIADDGRFRFLPMDDELALIVSAAGYVPTVLDDVDLERIARGPISVVLDPSRSVTIRVVDEVDGRPIAGARVDVQRVALELFPSLGTHTTDEHGTLALDVFPARGGFVAVEANGYFDEDHAIGPDQAVVDVELERARVVHVRVVDADGDDLSSMVEVDEPSPGLFSFGRSIHCSAFSVVAMPFDPRTVFDVASDVELWRFAHGGELVDANQGVVTIGASDSRAAITLPRTWPSDSIHVAALSSSGLLASARVVDLASEITLQVDLDAWRDRIAWVGVRAVDASTGSPIARFATAVVGAGHVLPFAQSTSRGSGTSWTMLTRSGVFDVVVAADGYAPCVVPDVDVEAGDPPDPFVVRLTKGARIEGRVEAPIVGPYFPNVVAYDEHGWRVGDVTLDESGRFVLDGLPVGRVRLRMSDPSLGSCDVEVTTNSGASTEVTLAPKNPRNVGLAMPWLEARPDVAVVLDVVDANGVPLGVPSSSLAARDIASMRWSVPAGTWTFRIRTLRERARSATVVVPVHGEVVVTID
ncbi:MAG: sigma-70 family RNA polymerase sigma factor [Planctomycetes bacterium]|nr:sigma-70 family RNA polymerase sigma factor [Planctomycetota bacterium]